MAQSGNITHSDFNDLVFEDRNKAYGAYVLRKKYADNILVSLLIGVAIVGLVVAIPYISAFIASFSPKTEEVVVPIDFTNMEPPPIDEKKEEIIPPPEEVAPPPAQVESVQFTAPVVTTEEVNEVITTEEVQASNPGAITQSGSNDFLSIPGDGDGAGSVVEETREQVFTIVEVMPEFSGGEAALAKYLQKNIVYPERAKTMGIEGKVYVSFVIDQFGNVNDVKILRGIGGGCDDEALRVVKKMPRWNPGKQGGRPVKVQFNLPIEFKLS